MWGRLRLISHIFPTVHLSYLCLFFFRLPWGGSVLLRNLPCSSNNGSAPIDITYRSQAPSSAMRFRLFLLNSPSASMKTSIHKTINPIQKTSPQKTARPNCLIVDQTISRKLEQEEKIPIKTISKKILHILNLVPFFSETVLYLFMLIPPRFL